MFTVVKQYSPGIVFTLLTLLLFSGTTPCFAAKKTTHTIRVMGTGAIIDEDTSSAKDKAISSGLIAAVDTVITKILPRKTIISNFAAINEILFNYTDTFIQGYKVHAESRYENNYRVMIEAVVSEKKIKNRLIRSGIVIDPSNKYKVLFLVSENNLADLSPQFWWAKGKSYVRTVSDTTMSKELKKKGFEILRHRQIPPELLQSSGENDEPNETLSKEDAVKIGLAFGADIVITGRAVAEQTPNTMGEDRSFTGAISIRLIRTDTGETLGTVSKKAVKVHTDEAEGSRDALTEAAITVSGETASKINIAMKQEDNKPSMIEVVIEGENFFVNYSRLIKKLKAITGVKRIRQREKRPNRSIIVVNYIGNGKALAQALIAETYDDFGLNISEVTRNHIRIEMVPKTDTLFEQ